MSSTPTVTRGACVACITSFRPHSLNQSPCLADWEPDPSIRAVLAPPFGCTETLNVPKLALQESGMMNDESNRAEGLVQPALNPVIGCVKDLQIIDGILNLSPEFIAVYYCGLIEMHAGIAFLRRDLKRVASSAARACSPLHGWYVM